MQIQIHLRPINKQMCQEYFKKNLAKLILISSVETILLLEYFD